MQNSRQNYASLQEVIEGDDEPKVLVHTAETSRTRWNHIEDLDQFLRNVYEYHQEHGFLCILLQKIFDIIKFIFIVCFTTYLVYGIDYDILFRRKPTPNNTNKVTFNDFMLPVYETIGKITFITWILLIIAMLYGIFRIIRLLLKLKHFYDIKQFYNIALRIDDKSLDNLTWHEVQQKVIIVQTEQSMCVHKRELTDLDIYHRILRQQNYFIAMINKNLLPPTMNVPFLGPIVYFTRGLQCNMRFLLFQSPWGAFKDSWHLKDEYKRATNRKELASKMKCVMYWFAFINLIFCPLIFSWQLVNILFEHAELIRREPSILSTRRWSLYGRYYLSHFNELDHELNTRLMRAHRLATRYLSAFYDPVIAVISRFFSFISTSLLCVIVYLTILDEDVLTVEHVLMVLTILGVILVVCKSLSKNETNAWCPDTILSNILAHTHYLPPGWRDQAHTTRIRTEFQQLFQLRASALIEELLSPFLTPYLLAFHLAPKALSFVDFFHNFTVSVTGVGDVCSFAQMDIRKHGNPEWHDNLGNRIPNQYAQGEDGKVELSLIHFTHTNPNWKPPNEAVNFIESVHHEGSMMAASFPDPFNSYLNDNLEDSSLRYFKMNGPNSLSMGRTNLEGPNEFTARDISYSTMYLHDRHNRLHEHKQSSRRDMHENTPLLSSP